MIYRIRDWSEHYERSDLKKTRNWAWIGMPIKHDGKGYRKLMRRNPDLYGAWVLVLQVAAKCAERGVLADEDGPLTPEDLELKTDMPAARFGEMLTACHEIGWLEASEDDGATWDTFNAHPDTSGRHPEASGHIPTTDRQTDRTDNTAHPDESGRGAPDGADGFEWNDPAGSGNKPPKPKREPKATAKAKTGSNVEIPPELDTPEFLAAWDEWQQHRREIRKALTKTTAAKQIKQLAAWGVARAVRAIQHTITQGYTGLIEPNAPPDSAKSWSEREKEAEERIARELRTKAGAE